MYLYCALNDQNKKKKRKKMAVTNVVYLDPGNEEINTLRRPISENIAL